ncbi:MAG: response regulator, partial [Bacteroidota bacterium]
MKLLLISTEEGLAKMLQIHPPEYPLRFDLTSHFEEAKDRLGTTAYDVLILDGKDVKTCPIEFLAYLRKIEDSTPVLYVQSHKNQEELISVFDAGADDCLSRPIYRDEFFARIRALYRRYRFQGKEEVNFEEIKLDLESREVRIF